MWWWNTESFSSDNGKETRMPVLTTSVHHCARDPCPNKPGKEKGYHTWKEGKALTCRHNCVYIKKYKKNYLK